MVFSTVMDVKAMKPTDFEVVVKRNCSIIRDRG